MSLTLQRPPFPGPGHLQVDKAGQLRNCAVKTAILTITGKHGFFLLHQKHNVVSRVPWRMQCLHSCSHHTKHLPVFNTALLLVFLWIMLIHLYIRAYPSQVPYTPDMVVVPMC